MSITSSDALSSSVTDDLFFIIQKCLRSVCVLALHSVVSIDMYLLNQIGCWDITHN